MKRNMLLIGGPRHGHYLEVDPDTHPTIQVPKIDLMAAMQNPDSVPAETPILIATYVAEKIAFGAEGYVPVYIDTTLESKYAIQYLHRKIIEMLGGVLHVPII